jgi:antitoxin ParD1/3/4
LEHQQKLQALELADLRAVIQAGIVSGSGVPAEEVFDRLEKKYAVMGKGDSGGCGWPRPFESLKTPY